MSNDLLHYNQLLILPLISSPHVCEAFSDLLHTLTGIFIKSANQCSSLRAELNCEVDQNWSESQVES